MPVKGSIYMARCPEHCPCFCTDLHEPICLIWQPRDCMTGMRIHKPASSMCTDGLNRDPAWSLATAELKSSHLHPMTHTRDSESGESLYAKQVRTGFGQLQS